MRQDYFHRAYMVFRVIFVLYSIAFVLAFLYESRGQNTSAAFAWPSLRELFCQLAIGAIAPLLIAAIVAAMAKPKK